MNSIKETLSQVVGRGGRPAIVDMTVAQVRDVAPEFCDRLEAGLPRPVACGPYLHRTVGELAEAEHIDIAALLRAVDAKSATPRAPAEAHREWPGPRLTAAVSELELAREIEQLRAEPAWQEFDRNAKTLVKNPELRIVLMTLKPGARLDEHVAPGAISIQVLSGRVRVHLPSESVELPAGELVAVAPAIRHDLEALESSAILLTIAQPRTEPRPERDVPRPVTAPQLVVEPARAFVAPVHLSPDEQANMTEGDMRPVFDTEVRGNCFAPIEGYTIVKSGPTSFRHHGFYVVDEPCKNMKPAPQRENYIKRAEPHPGARIPGEVMPGEVPVDTASRSLIPPTPAQLGITNSVDASYPDLRHLARGGPQMASR